MDERQLVGASLLRQPGPVDAARQVATLRTILDSVSDAIFVHALDGSILDVNDTMLRMYRVSRPEAAGFSIQRDYSSPENRPGALDEYWARALAGAEQQFPWLARRPCDGSTFPVEVTLRRLELPLGAALLATVRDVSAHRQAEAALQTELAFSTALLDTLGALVVVIDRTGAVVRMNRACRELAGYSPEEMGDPAIWRALLLPEDRATVRSVIDRIFAGQYPLSNENVWVTRSGERRRIAWSNTALLDGGGKVTHAISTGIDLTDQRRLEAAYGQAQRMESVGRLAGGVAHDFNNLLTVVAGAAELILSTLPAEHIVREDAQTILHAADRASALTRQLLVFARRQTEAARLVDVGALIAGLRPMLRRITPEHVTLTVEPMEGLWPVRADPGQIEQVLVNLAVNARDAMPGGGRLAIAATNRDLAPATTQGYQEQAPGPYVQVTVADTGVGMDAEVQARAFEPFFTTKPVGHGTGLGLATCYSIVRQHGGAIWLDSAPGRGTVVTFYLPAVPEARPHAPGAGATAPVGGGETILLVEDDADLRPLVARMLRDRGYTVIEAEDGQAALCAAADPAAVPIALLLTDVVMPELGGPDLAERLRAAIPGLPVLFMSGYTEDPLLHNAVRSSDAAFIAKPFTAAALAEQVRRALHGGERPADDS